MSLYMVRQTAERAWEMSKWSDDGRDGAEQRPTEVYYINGAKCWCPSNKARCKHLDILDRFRESTVPFGPTFSGRVYNDETDGFTWLLGHEVEPV